MTMTRLAVMVAVAAMAAGVVRAQAPATKPALPAGHPDISQMVPPAQPRPAGLPAGHPDISGLTRPPATTQVAKVGKVTIKVTQGTRGAATVAGDKVTLKLFDGDGHVVGSYDTQVDEAGTAVVKNVPVWGSAQPVASVMHNGVEFQGAGEPLGPQHPEQAVAVTVYETTEERPAYQLSMRHVLVEPADGALHVREVMVIDLPGDRMWLGAKQEAGRQPTWAVSLPEAVGEVNLVEGFQEGGAKLEQGKLMNLMPLVPGQQQYQITYTVAAKNGTAVMKLAADAPTKRLMVLMPEGGSTVTADGLEGMVGEMERGQRQRVYQAMGLEAGKAVGLTVSGIAAAGAGTGAKAPAALGAPMVVAAVGGGVLLLVAAAFLFMKGPKAKKAA